ncbi:hypothetical protein CZ809_03866 [Photobacterium piscicola]|uniref:Fimbrial-type adhesion domain-containing protein n=1 Tax=Photobacterium piscicola TaxID=1378299 RepID=A0A1T5I569_9GAMM|nr:fimbrial protein [Photobacterium piscicola]SKC34254.1 hypothetical protein CZ809_03866 [Photobacterium piscicola]
MKYILATLLSILYFNKAVAGDTMPGSQCGSAGGVTYNIPLPDSIDISRYNVGDVVHTIEANTITGVPGYCSRVNNSKNDIFYGLPYPANDSSISSGMTTDYNVGSDPQGIINVIQHQTFRRAIVLGRGKYNPALPGRSDMNFIHPPFSLILKKKPIGNVKISLRGLFSPSFFNSWIEGTSNSMRLENGKLIMNSLEIVDRVSCNITTNDSIDFGNILASTINGGVGPSKTVNVGINCDGVPLKYTMKFSSAINVPTTNLTAGILGSTTHNNMGYQLTWGDSQIGGTDNHLSLDVDYPSKAAKQNQTVPIKLKPVSLRYESVKPGPVDASLRITIRID